MTEVADSAHGICTHPLQALNWSGVSGASLAPKSTVRLATAEIPPPEPIPLYCSSYPNADPTAGIHCDTSGCTNVLPAPEIVVPDCPAGAAPAAPAATAASAAAAASATRVRIGVKQPNF